LAAGTDRYPQVGLDPRIPTAQVFDFPPIGIARQDSQTQQLLNPGAGYGNPTPVIITPAGCLRSAHVLQSIALAGNLSIHGVRCQIDRTGQRDRT